MTGILDCSEEEEKETDELTERFASLEIQQRSASVIIKEGLAQSV